MRSRVRRRLSLTLEERGYRATQATRRTDQIHEWIIRKTAEGRDFRDEPVTNGELASLFRITERQAYRVRKIPEIRRILAPIWMRRLHKPEKVDTGALEHQLFELHKENYELRRALREQTQALAAATSKIRRI